MIKTLDSIINRLRGMKLEVSLEKITAEVGERRHPVLLSSE
jgi:hypothetical protein